MREALEKEISQKKGVIEEGSDYKMGRDGLPMVFRELTMEMVMSKVKKKKNKSQRKDRGHRGRTARNTECSGGDLPPHHIWT